MQNSDGSIKRLTFQPSAMELSFYENLFRNADATNNGKTITVDEARNILSLSSLSHNNLDIILSMVTTENESTLTKEQFYVAVRLIQFRQNRETVKNLNLTVPENIQLNPPIFKNINEKGLLINSTNVDMNLNDGSSQISNKSKESDQSSYISSSELSFKYQAMGKELEKLKKELHSTTKQLNEVAKDNYKLRTKRSKSKSPPGIQSPANRYVENTNINNRTGKASFQNSFSVMNTVYEPDAHDPYSKDGFINDGYGFEKTQKYHGNAEMTAIRNPPNEHITENDLRLRKFNPNSKNNYRGMLVFNKADSSGSMISELTEDVHFQTSRRPKFLPKLSRSARNIFSSGDSKKQGKNKNLDNSGKGRRKLLESSKSKSSLNSETKDKRGGKYSISSSLGSRGRKGIDIK